MSETREPGPLEPLEAGLVEALAQPGAHPGDPDADAGIEVVQTHLSWVFLTRRRVYKLRKSVCLGFVDFGSRRERNADCLREVELNRRLAPDVYLGLAPVRRASGTGFRLDPVAEGLAVGPGEEGPEHCVVMRRLPEGRDALSLLDRGLLGPRHLAEVARLFASFHRAHALGDPPTAETWREALLAPVEENFRHLAGPESGLPPDRVDALAARSRAAFRRLLGGFEARRRSGRIVDGHGDLHLQHLWFEEGCDRPVVIDCLEFDASLRRVDTASEVAFLAMDLLYRDRGLLAEGFLARYADECDDFGLYSVVDWFGSYRAGVRAKVACLAARDSHIEAAQREAAGRSARRHFELAEAWLEPRRPGALVVVCGTVGSGKSTLAAALAEASGGVVVSSDRTRKRLAGLAPEQRAGAGTGEGLYDPRRTEEVYAALLERADPVVASGRLVILDATWALREQRAAAAAWARERGIEGHLVEARCSPDEARERLARRRDSGRGASDAGPELLPWSLARFESPEEWEEARRHAVDTDVGDLGTAVSKLLRRLPEPWHRSCNSSRKS